MPLLGLPWPAACGGVAGGDRAGRPPQGEEHRALAAPAQQPGQQQRGADLVAYLIDDQKMSPEALRTSLAAYTDSILGHSADPPCTRKEA